jgi:predicted esterase
LNVAFAAVVLIAASVTCLAQDAGQVLRVSVGFRTLKNTANMSPETRTEVDRLQRLAEQANSQRRYGEALKHMYHGMALMRGQPWTPSTALTSALTLKPGKVIVEPGTLVRLKVTQIYQLDEKLTGAVSARLALFPPRGGEAARPLKVLKTIEGIEPDFTTKAHELDVTVPDIENGNYRLELRLMPATGEAVSKSVTLRVERGLDSRIASGRDRVEKVKTRLRSQQKDDLIATLASAEYWLSLADLANTGAIGVERLNFDTALREAGITLDGLEAGKDPYATRRGDFKKAYRSQVDNTLQPYRVFVPSTYDGKKAFPLIIALHGMGGDENSYFDGYANGAFKTEAEQRGYLVACPKGREPASMYVGSAERDVLDVMAEMQRSYRIDPARIYMTGHSMGGFGTWSIAVNHPQLFAALAPVAGGGNVLDVKKIAHIPQIVVHGDDDRTVPVARSRTMVNAAKAAGANVKYIEVPKGNHVDIVVPTFKDVFDWFDTYSRKPMEMKAGSPSR